MVTYRSATSVIVSLTLFVAAGVCEIGGGWLVWKWRKDGWNWGFFILGSLILVAYGLVPTLQDQVFGRTYAAYGGFFIVLSLMWGWAFDGDRPDKWDAIGGVIAIAGVAVIMFVPRKTGAGALPTSQLIPLPVPSPSPSPGIVSSQEGQTQSSLQGQSSSV